MCSEPGAAFEGGKDNPSSTSDPTLSNSSTSSESVVVVLDEYDNAGVDVGVGDWLRAAAAAVAF